MSGRRLAAPRSPVLGCQDVAKAGRLWTESKPCGVQCGSLLVGDLSSSGRRDAQRNLEDEVRPVLRVVSQKSPRQFCGRVIDVGAGLQAIPDGVRAMGRNRLQAGSYNMERTLVTLHYAIGHTNASALTNGSRGKPPGYRGNVQVSRKMTPFSLVTKTIDPGDGKTKRGAASS